MHKYLIALVTLAAGISAVAAQPCKQQISGTKTLYTAPGQTPGTPAHYGPVFINYAGRHGARHLTKEVNTSYAWQLLHQADSAQALTAEGLRLKQMVDRLDKVEHKKVKSISAEGRDELRGIGGRMVANYPAVFAGKPQISIAVTKEIRTQQSADAFLQGLKAHLKDSAVITRNNDDIHLRFYDAAPAYVRFEKSGSWQQPMQKLEDALQADHIRHDLLSRIFKPAFASALAGGQAVKFTDDVFGFLTIAYSLDAEIKQAGFTPPELDFKTFFMCNELTALGRLDEADDYLKKGPGTDANGLQVRIAVPLLVEFIQSTDEYIKTGKPAADLRFGHAETILPFAALLNISTADKATTDLNELDKVFQAGNIACLGANIQWVVYRNTQGEYLVKVLLNEKEARIDGLSSNTWPYYNWKALRGFYTGKLAGMHVQLTDDMEAYLTSLQ